MIITTGVNAYTTWLEDGRQVYPCNCGETHRGEHAICTFNEHNCFHENALTDMDGYFICLQCGRTFIIKPPQTLGDNLEARG